MLRSVFHTALLSLCLIAAPAIAQNSTVYFSGQEVAKVSQHSLKFCPMAYSILVRTAVNQTSTDEAYLRMAAIYAQANNLSARETMLLLNFCGTWINGYDYRKSGN